MNELHSKTDGATMAGSTGPLAALELRSEWEKGNRPDVAKFLRQTCVLSPAERIAVLRADQELRWQAGIGDAVESYLEAFGWIGDKTDHVWQLIQNEYLLRKELGEHPSVSDFAKRFPQFQEKLSRLDNSRSPSAQVEKSLIDTSSEQKTVRFPALARGEVNSAPSDLASGPLVVPGYEILEQVGRGSMGVIFKARSLRLKRLVALKMVIAGELSRPDHLLRFRSEAETVARLQHPNIVQIFEVGEMAGRPFLVLEYLDGGTLSAYLAGRPIAAKDAANLTLTLAEAMAHAHAQGIVHRDLKPGNVLLTHTPAFGPQSSSTITHTLSWSGVSAQRTGPPFVPKIADFGLAKCIEEVSSNTQTGEILGTPSYMSPEQACGNVHQIGPASDVHSLGAMLYEMLTGRPPFQGATPLDTVLIVKSEEPVPPTRLQPRLPRDLETICLKCLQKDPARRYADAGQLAEDLRSYLAGVPIQARPVGPVERGLKWMRRRPALATLFVVSVLGSMAFLANTISYNRQLRRALTAEADQRKRAEEKEKLATQAANREADASKEANRQLVRLMLANGVKNMDDGDLSSSLVWFSEALKAEQKNGDAGGAVGRQSERMHRMRLAELMQQCPRLVQYWRYDGAPAMSRFSRDGSKVVIVDESKTIHVNDARTGKALVEPYKVVDANQVVDIDADGQTALAVVRELHGLQIIDLASSRHSVREAIPPNQFETARFGPDGKWIAVGHYDGLSIMDRATLSFRKAPRVDHRVSSLFVSPSGRRIVGGHFNRSFGVFDLTNNRLKEFSGPQSGPAQIGAFRIDEKMFALLRTENEVALMDLETGVSTLKPLWHSSPVTALTFSPDGSRLAAGCKDGAIVIWSTRHSRRIQTLRHRGRVTAVAYSPDGSMLLSASADQTAIVWDWNSGQPTISPLRHGGGSVLGASFAADGRRILTHSSDGGVRIWDLAAAVPDQSFARRGVKLDSAHFSPRGDRIATVATNGVASVFDRTGAGKKLFDVPSEGGVKMVRFNSSGSMLAALGIDGSVQVLNSKSGAPLRSSISVRNNQINNIEWDSTGKRLLLELPYGFNVYSLADQRDAAAIGNDLPVVFAALTAEARQAIDISNAWGSIVRCFDLSKSVEIDKAPLRFKFRVASEAVALAVGEKASAFAIGCRDGVVRQFSLVTGKALGGAEIRHGSHAGAVAFAPDAKRIATGSDDGTARIWDQATGAPLTPVLTHGSGVRRLQFNADGMYLLTLSEDRTARIWDSGSGLPVTLPIDPGEAQWAEFSPNGLEVLTAGSDGIARIRTLQTEEKSADELASVAQLLSGLRRKVSLGLSPITAADEEVLWNKVLRQYPKYAHVSLQAAAAWHRTTADDAEADRLWASAEFHLRRLIDFEPNSLTLPLRLAEVQIQLGNLDGALRLLDTLVVKLPGEHAILRKRSFLRSRIGDERGALADLDRMENRPGRSIDPVALLARSAIYSWSKSVQEKQQAYNKAWDEYFGPRLQQRPVVDESVAIDPQDWQWFIDEFLNPHLEKRPKNADLIRLRAASEWALGRWDLASADLRQAIELESTFVCDWILLASSLRSLNRNVDALAACDRGIAVDSKSATLWRIKGSIHASMGRDQLAAAASALEHASALDPTPGDWQQLGNLYIQLGNSKRAADVLAKAMAATPPRYQVGYRLVLAQLENGRIDAYRQTCRQLVEAARDPNSKLDRNTVGWIACLQRGALDNYDELIRMLTQEAEAVEDKYAILNTLGAAYFRAGKNDLAVETLKRAIAGRPDEGNGWDWFLLASAEAARGNAKQARDYFTKADAWLDVQRSGKAPVTPGSNPNSWENRIELNLLREEAKQAVERPKK